jgi:hypothetical protein
MPSGNHPMVLLKKISAISSCALGWRAMKEIRGGNPRRYGHTAAVLALFLIIVPASAVPVSAQSACGPSMSPNTVCGRAGAGQAGPPQAIPFATLNAVLAAPQVANTVWAGPAGGVSALPTWRALVGGDLPVPPASTLGGIESLTCATHSWLNSISIAGVPACAQPAVTDLASISADSVVGNASGSSAAPAALTQTQLTALVNPFSSSLSGAAPSSGGGTTNFLRADGNWSVPPSGAMTLLNTLTASNSASLSDTTSLTASYSSYEIVFENLLPANNADAFEFLVHSNGSFQATSYLSTVLPIGSAAQQPTTYIGITSSAATANSGAGMAGVGRIFNPSQTTSFKLAQGESTGQIAGPTLAFSIWGGMWTGGTTAVDGFKVQTVSGGNITSGTIKIYGIN